MIGHRPPGFVQRHKAAAAAKPHRLFSMTGIKGAPRHLGRPLRAFVPLCEPNLLTTPIGLWRYTRAQSQGRNCSLQIQARHYERAKQSSAGFEPLDCFVASLLAMTAQPMTITP
jgi:hypothetical protein